MIGTPLTTRQRQLAQRALVALAMGVLKRRQTAKDAHLYHAAYVDADSLEELEDTIDALNYIEETD